MKDNKLKEVWLQRTKKHIWLVNEFAKEVGYCFPDHDKEKLTSII